MVSKSSPRLQLFAATGCLFLALALGACGDSQDDFTSGLSADPCNGNFPACNTEVGCILSDLSYTTGTFPGSGQFLVQLTGPSNVEIDFYLINPTGSGSQTQITWFEAGCTSDFQDCITGNAFTGEAETANGVFTASQQLSSPGDHLITFNSDATSQFLVKAVVTPIGGGVVAATDGQSSTCQ
jgi:hypothetical protein